MTNGRYDLNVQSLQNKFPLPRQHLLFWLATEINFIKFRRLGPARARPRVLALQWRWTQTKRGEHENKALWDLEGVLVHFLGGDEKQLLVPPLFLALSSSLSYPLIFSNTTSFLMACLPFPPPANRLGSAAFRPRSRRTAKRAVPGRLPAPPQMLCLCVF